MKGVQRDYTVRKYPGRYNKGFYALRRRGETIATIEERGSTPDGTPRLVIIHATTSMVVFSSRRE